MSWTFLKRWFGVKRPRTVRNFRPPRSRFLRLRLEELEERLAPATLVVTNPLDTVVANLVSLRQAVASADTDAAARVSDTITFDPSLGSATITLTQGPLALSGAAGSVITIDGSSPSTPLTISGNNAIGIFQVDSGVQAVFTNLTIEDGKTTGNGGAILNAGTLTVSNITLSNNAAASGGAIENQGTLTISNVTFADNSASDSGGAVDNTGQLTVSDSTFSGNGAVIGGAISNEGTLLTVSNTTFSGNTASASGGAVDNSAGTLAITGSYFISNNAQSGAGGAIESTGRTVTVANTTVSSNVAATAGGGIDNAAGTLTVTGSALSGNSSSQNGGGFSNHGALTVSASTLAGNNGSQNGGGIFNSGTLTLSSDTVSANSASSTGGGIDMSGGTLAMQNTIVAGNTSGGANPDIAGSITTDDGNNLLGTAANNSTTIPNPGLQDVFSNSPRLGALGNYGGPTQTMDVLAGSPAIGAGNAGAVGLLSTDQRGLPRVVNGSLDIGAFQTQPPALVFSTLGETADAGQPAGPITVQLLDLDGNPAPAGSGGVTVTLSSNSTGGSFAYPDGAAVSGGHITIPQSASSATFDYTDSQPGTPTLTASAAGFPSATQQETILPGPISNTPSTDIVVGRTLSAYFSGNVQNNQETITFTVYNQQADSITGVLLTDTLEPGVTLLSASQQPDQSGQNLAWSLGTIEGDYWSSVSITVSLANANILQLDTGAQAFATLNAGPISNATPAAVLTMGNVDPHLLASTPDANTTDPFIQQEATILDYNPQNIYNFLQQNITYNSYIGSLRGARGTLWSDAGNALDVASLGVALMRASGIPAQYVEGTLSVAQAQALILSMFPASYQTVGYVPAGAQVADPADDPQLLSETENHYWFQFDADGRMMDADPLIAGATVGQAFTAETGTFTEAPDELRTTTEVSLTAEIYNKADAAFSMNPFQDTVVLDQTFYDVDLVGRPLSLGFNTFSTSENTIFSTTTNNYTPYLAWGNDAYDSTHDQIIMGQSFQEVLTNFPLSSSILTGLFLNITENGLEGPPQTFSRTLVDRIGYAARQGLESTTISVPAGNGPALTNLDVFTLDVTAAAPDPHLTAALNQELQTDATEVAGVQNTAADAQIAETYATDYGIDLTRILGNNFLTLSQLQTSTLATTSDVTAYFDSPRIVLISQQLDTDSSTTSAGLTTAIDLVSDSPRVESAPGQAVAATFLFNLTRGMFENLIERDMVQVLVPSGETLSVDNTYDVFTAAAAQGIGFTYITSANLSSLDGLNIPTDSKARITTEALNGFVAIVPNQSVMLNGVPTIAWAEINLATGEYIGVDENGGNEGALEFLALVSEDLTLIANVTKFFSPVVGFDVGAVLSVSYELNVETGNQEAAKVALMNQKTEAQDEFAKALGFWENLAEAGKKASQKDILGVFKSLEAVIKLESSEAETLFPVALKTTVLALTGQDPPFTGIVYDPLPLSTLSANLANGTAGPTSGVAPGPLLGAVQVPTVSVSNQLDATWSSIATSDFQATKLSALEGFIVDSTGQTVGSGTVSLAAANLVAATVSGIDSYSVNGTGRLSFYGPAESSLGVSGNWDNYTATVTGNISITLTTDGLTLNGLTLPVGTYTITTSSAILSGGGQTTFPNFAGSASITATNSTINLGPGTGNITVGAASLDVTNSATLDGYTGSITVAAGGRNNNNTDSVTLNGNTANVLTVSGTPTALTTDQNTPATFQAKVNTSLADSYTITAQAPAGWTVTIDTSGNVTATPAPGLQGGTYPIQVIVQSSSDPNLVAQTTVNVTVTPTQPRITLAVASDPLFTVPYNGAQVPTAFRASIQNLGPTADTYNLTFSNVPSSFTILNSGASATVPSGQTGIHGIYLQPNAGTSLPAPGTPISFTVTATSASDPAITQTQTETFIMPRIDAVTLVSDTPTQDLVPGGGWGFSFTLQNVGNVTETVDPTATIPAGLDLPGGFFSLNNVTLAPGQSVVETATHGSDPTLPLNSTQTVTVTATYGPAAAPLTQTVQMTLDMILAGTQYIGGMGIAAAQAGLTDMADRLNDLAADLTNLFEDPTNAVDKSQALADIDSLSGQFADDPFLAGLDANLSVGRGYLASATTAAQVQTAANVLGGDLNYAGLITDEAEHSFTASLFPNSAVAQPGAPVYYTVELRNTGSETTTYSFVVYNPPTDLQFTFSQPSITLQPGQAIAGGPNGVTVAVTETGNSLIAAGFGVTVSAPGIGLTVPGSVTLRPAFVSVTEVDATPPFTQPGSSVDVTAKVLNAVNEEQQALASYTVADGNGNVVFTSQPVPLTLTVETSLATVDLGSFATTGLPPGSYTITVNISDTSGRPIPGGTGQGSVFVGSPVSGSLSVSPSTLPAGGGTMTNKLQVTAQTTFSAPLTLLGQVQTTPTGQSIALDGNYAYVAGTNGIDIVDISNPNQPELISTFASNVIVQGGSASILVDGNDLIVSTQVDLNSSGFKLLIYSLTNPLAPQLLSNTPIGYAFLKDMIIDGNTLLVPTGGYDYFAGTLSYQFGSVLSIDVSNPAKPVLSDVLYNDRGMPDGGDTQQLGGTIVASGLAYISSTTSTGANYNSGVGRVLLVDDSNPTNLSVLGEVDIPGTLQIFSIAVSGDRALVVGSTVGAAPTLPDSTFSGNLTLSVLDISNPDSPQLLGTTLVTDSTTSGGAVALGNGLFAVSGATIAGQAEILIVDPTNPNNLVVAAIPTPAPVTQIAVSGDLLYTASSAGVGIYQINSLVGEPVTISVEVPNNTGVSVVPGSFNIPPTQTITGASYNTYVWVRTLAYGESVPTFTWQSTVSNLLPGEARQVTLGGTVDFVSQGTAGTFSLPPTAVASVHFIQLDPASETVAPGETTTFQITVKNPSSQGQILYLSVVGVPASWINVQNGVSIVGNGSATVELQFTPNASAELGTYMFQVSVSYNFAAAGFISTGYDTVQGTLIVAGRPIIPPYLEAHGVVETLTPAQATVGQGTSTAYTVQLINTGSADETFALAATLPSGIAGTFSQETVDVPPGVSNFRDVTLTLTPAVGTTPGNDPFTVTAASTTTSATSSASGTLTIVDNGVSVTLDKSTGNPGNTFMATITNTGTVSDTFDLTVAGPAALVTNLGQTAVTLAPGAQQVVPIITGAVNFADPGALQLVVTATSQTNPAVASSATAALTIPNSMGMTAQLTPASQTLTQPGAATFILQVNNTGNLEDSYTATITGITSGVTASLTGLDGAPTQTIPIFILPGLSTGAIELTADLTVVGSGTVTVQVTSLSKSGVTASTTATVVLVNQPPALAGLPIVNGSTAVFNIVSAIGNGATATITTDPDGSGHGFWVGELVTLTGTSPGGPNGLAGTVTITAVPSATSFSFASTYTGSETFTGATVTAALAGVQRSMVHSIVYNFTEPVTLTAAAFTITAIQNSPGSTVGVVPTVNVAAVPFTNEWVVTFTDPTKGSVIGNSIANGAYTIAINPAFVTAVSGGQNLSAGETDTFYRLYGDVTGAESVTSVDGSAFNAVWGNRAYAAGYVAALDYNDDGKYTNIDANAFNRAFNIRYSVTTSI